MPPQQGYGQPMQYAMYGGGGYGGSYGGSYNSGGGGGGSGADWWGS